MEVDSAPARPLLFIRRQVFEHALTLPSLTAPLAAGVDLAALSHTLQRRRAQPTHPRAASTTPAPPLIRFPDLADALASTVKWDSPHSLATLLVDALATNAPDAFRAANPTPPTPTPDLPPSTLVPIPELLTFIHLHTLSRSLMVSSRENADAVWPDADVPLPAKLPEPAAVSPSPKSPRSTTAPAVVFPDIAIPDSPVTPRRRASRESSQLLQSPTIKASAYHDITRETNLVLDNLPSLLALVAAAHGDPDGAAIPRHYLRHLAFLLSTRTTPAATATATTAAAAPPPHHGGARLEDVVPAWRDDPDAVVPVAAVVEAVRAALKAGLVGDAATTTPDPLLVEINDLERRTVIRAGTHDAPIAHRDFRIARCSESYVYLLAPLSRVSVVGCVDCTIFVGAAASFSIVGCGRVRVITVARRLRVTNCVDSVFYVCTARRPHVVGDNRGIQLAPYNANYPDVDAHAREVGVDLAENKWDDFADEFHAPGPMDPKSPSHATEAPASGVALLPPEKFMPFMVPVLNEDPALQKSCMPSPAVVLPAPYAASLAARGKDVEALKTTVRQAQAEYARRTSTAGDALQGAGRDFSAIVQEHFRDWLATSGNMRQVNDLMRLEQDLQKT